MKRDIRSSGMTFALPNMFVRNFYLFKLNFSRPLARFRLRFPNFHVKKILPKVLLVGIVVGIIAGALMMSRKPIQTEDSRLEVQAAKATQAINKEFLFDLKDDKGKVVTTIKYTVEAAELRDEIVVKGQRASSVKGRTFLIIPLKITNTYNQAIEIQTKDYLRLVVNNKEGELLAADIHNDPVTIQALSTKQTRLGFPINDSDTNLSLHVGELNGEKETIALTLK